MEADYSALRGELEEMRVRMREMELRDRTAPPRLAAGCSLNLTNRAMVMRMAQKGKQPRQIASALGVARGEVMLAIKIERLQKAQNASRF